MAELERTWSNSIAAVKTTVVSTVEKKGDKTHKYVKKKKKEKNIHRTLAEADHLITPLILRVLSEDVSKLNNSKNKQKVTTFLEN